ncbi:unnamed protein product [Protopolystoma xenopodis]|uniref:Secreted protein n=1 Tax=Protopolystoma xenopodis TaxID=117903 RepID=A0A448WX65_9PLAT|nr:unnamed protein product [Protopolystoma xenopodis]
MLMIQPRRVCLSMFLVIPFLTTPIVTQNIVLEVIEVHICLNAMGKLNKRADRSRGLVLSEPLWLDAKLQLVNASDHESTILHFQWFMVAVRVSNWPGS